MPDIYFQCPSCEGELVVDARGIGKRLPCPFCEASVRVPDSDYPSANGEREIKSDARPIPPRARSLDSLPRKRNESLRPATDKRKRRQESNTEDPSLSGADLSTLDPPVRDLIRKELEKLEKLEKLQAKSSPSPSSSRRRPPPPLGQHGAVVSRDHDSGPSRSVADTDPNRRRRIAPQTRSDKPLPELVTLESMDLESDVARSWGEDAVINTRRLHRLATLIVVLIVAGGAWLIYETISSWTKKEPATENETLVEEPEPENPLLAQIATTLDQFLKSGTPEEKAQFVRNRETIIPAMEEYYLIHGREPLNFNPELTVRPFMFQNIPFLSIEGEYSPSLRSFHMEMERLPDGTLLIDWPSLTGYNEHDWNAFLQNRPQEPVTFRLWLDTQSYYGYDYRDPEKYLSCGLREGSPDGKLIFGYAPRGTTAEAQLATALENQRTERKSRQRVTLKVRFESFATRNEPIQLIVDEVVSEHWVTPTVK